MHETVLLSDPGSPLRVEYSRAAMEAIRERAREGLMAAPRVGVGVGGLLLGVREGERTRIVDSMEIPCCHSGGPSFKLTAEEMQQAREMMAEAGEITLKTRVTVVGWYCSKTRGDAVLNEFDQQFHDELFPDAWQIALVLRPSAAEPMRAVFYFRDGMGAVSRGVETEVDEWAPPVEGDSHEVASPAPLEIKAVEVPVRPAPKKVIEMSPPAAAHPPDTSLPMAVPPVVNVRPAETTLADIIGAATADGEAPVRPRSLNADLFGAPVALPPRPKTNSKLIIGGAVAAVILLGGGGAWFTRDSWMAKPPVNLTSSELNGSLLIRWNSDSVKGVDHGTMYVSDGSGKQPEIVPLDRFQLGSGLLNYKVKTLQVTATLDAGTIHERTAWFAPAPVTPPAVVGGPPPLSPNAPAGAVAPSPTTAPTPTTRPAVKTPITTAPALDTPKP
jgi:proteasome lid subunit RPN8/RPN11